MSAASEEKNADFDNDEQQEEEEENNELRSFHNISELQALKISAADIKKLKEANYCTVESIAYAPRKEIVTIKGISDAKVEKVQEAGLSFIHHYIHSLRTYLKDIQI